jgi:hypothetical protein
LKREKAQSVLQIHLAAVIHLRGLVQPEVCVLADESIVVPEERRKPEEIAQSCGKSGCWVSQSHSLADAMCKKPVAAMRSILEYFIRKRRVRMLKKISVIFAVLLAAGVAGCATSPTVTSQTVLVAGVGPVEVEQLDVEIVDVDPVERMVIVRQGRQTWPVAVPEVFGDLQNINAGDRVQIRRVEGVVVGARRAPKGAKPAIVYTEAVSGPSFQNLPEKFVVRSLTVTARFESYDPATGIVSYVGPDGPRARTVSDPVIQNDIKRLRRGDMVTLTFAEGFHFQKY